MIYGEKNEDDDFKSLNGIGVEDDYIMARIYYEVDLDNVFFRKESDFESYQPPDDDLNIIETGNIPVFSFRYKTPFSKSEEEDFGKT